MAIHSFTTKELLIAECERRLAKYSQYHGYHTSDKGWKFAVATKLIHFKGSDIVPGEFVLIRYADEPYQRIDGKNYFEVAHLVKGFPKLAFPDSAFDSLVEIKTAFESIQLLE
jgi:hypothetical protein